MKRIILLLLLSVTTITGFSQLTSQIQAKRGVFTDQLYIKGRWINRVSTDMNTTDTTDDNVIATAKAVADYIRSKTMPINLQQVLSAGSTLTSNNTINGGNNNFTWTNNLSLGHKYRYEIDYKNMEVASRIYLSTFATTELTLKPYTSTLRFAGLNVINGVEQNNDRHTSIYSSSNLTGARSKITLDTGYLALSNGISSIGGKENKISINQNNIVIEGYNSLPFGPKYNMSLYLRGLPTSSSTTDSVVVKLQDGRLAYRGSNVSAGGGWTNIESNIYNSNPGYVGIGIKNPTAKFHIQSMEFGTEGITGYINPLWNTSGNPTAFKVNPLVISNGGGALLADFQYSGMPRFSIRHDGLLTLSGYTGGAFTGNPAYDLQINNSGEVIQKVAPKIYTALISQSGGNAPTAIILGTNTVGSITWTRKSQGVYTGTLSGAFPANKTWLVANQYVESEGIERVYFNRVNDNNLNLLVRNISNSSIDTWTNISIEIRVYP